ncbi:MAG: biotin carboxylase N-terminal domain-containing protein, partial [Candidatus Poseidoniaceae archaeon]|nr:biotin carboxylase N-terminal domain-containing protein [Candidatus Poseidoniaceae archaeon]
MVSKVLVANRGEIACRILRACNEAGLASVAIYAENDSSSMFVELADEAVLLSGETIAETYLDQQQILSIAESTGADAIHPGFGFLSERADFARAVTQAGLQWVGPSPEAIEKMGDKMTARITMRAAGVPVIPGEEIEHEDESDALAAIEEASHRVGYPMLLKASSGGGGKGMRAVHSPDQLIESAKGARREAIAAFGDGRVYVERLLTGSKHVEIQVLADRHGRTIHLGERECSVQRRHQKVFEEAPCATMTPELREAMGQAAVAAAEAVDYEGAGTVEFLLAPTGEFFFLEMNTRIQVEHPVTELVTGVDLVREQLRIAAGEAMSCGALMIRGHAIEVRLYAEDASNNFLPAIGPLAVFRPPEGPGVRLDTGVREGDEVTPNYDPMLAKLIVWAPSREEALQ